MSVFTPDDFAAHLTVATRLPVSHVEVESRGNAEFVKAVVAGFVPMHLPAWKSEVQLATLLLERVPYLRHDCLTLQERLELTRKALACSELLGHGGLGPADREKLAMDVFALDDEWVTIRLSRIRQAIRDLLD